MPFRLAPPAPPVGQGAKWEHAVRQQGGDPGQFPERRSIEFDYRMV